MLINLRPSSYFMGSNVNLGSFEVTEATVSRSVSRSSFHFLPEATGSNIFFPVSSILPGRNLFLLEVSEPWSVVLPNLVRSFLKHFDLWMTFDLWLGHFEKFTTNLGLFPTTPTKFHLDALKHYKKE